MNQDDLLAWTPPPQRHRNTDPDTSVEAARSIAPKVQEAQRLVLAWLKTQVGGATDEEISAAFDCKSSHFRTRRSELVEQSLVKDSGLRRQLASGRKGIVWVAV